MKEEVEEEEIVDNDFGKEKHGERLNEEEGKADNKGEGSDENDSQGGITVTCELAGLVINKREDGRYERVSSFTVLRFKLSGGDLFEWLDGLQEVIELI